MGAVYMWQVEEYAAGFFALGRSCNPPKDRLRARTIQYLAPAAGQESNEDFAVVPTTVCDAS